MRPSCQLKCGKTGRQEAKDAIEFRNSEAVDLSEFTRVLAGKSPVEREGTEARAEESDSTIWPVSSGGEGSDPSTLVSTCPSLAVRSSCRPLGLFLISFGIRKAIMSERSIAAQLDGFNAGGSRLNEVSSSSKSTVSGKQSTTVLEGVGSGATADAENDVEPAETECSPLSLSPLISN